MTRTYTISSEKGSLCLTAYTDRIIRVTYAKAPGAAATGNRESFMVTAQPASDIPVTTSSTEELFTCELPAVRAIVDKKNLSVRFERPDGTQLSRAFEQELQEYDLYRTVGGSTEEHQTVDGLRVTVTDADREYLRTAYHGKLTCPLTKTKNCSASAVTRRATTASRGATFPYTRKICASLCRTWYRPRATPTCSIAIPT